MASVKAHKTTSSWQIPNDACRTNTIQKKNMMDLFMPMENPDILLRHRYSTLFQLHYLHFFACIL